jgi:hypothetical protein
MKFKLKNKLAQLYHIPNKNKAGEIKSKVFLKNKKMQLLNLFNQGSVQLLSLTKTVLLVSKKMKQKMLLIQ